MEDEMTIESSLSIGEKCRITVSKRKVAEALGFNVIEAKGTPISFTFVRSLSEDEARERLTGELNQKVVDLEAANEILARQLAELRHSNVQVVDPPISGGKVVEPYVAEDGYCSIATLKKLTGRSDSYIRKHFMKRALTDKEKALDEFEKSNTSWLFTDKRKGQVPPQGSKKRRDGIIIDASFDTKDNWLDRLSKMFPDRGYSKKDIEKMIRTGELKRVNRAKEREQLKVRGLHNQFRLYRLANKPGVNGATQQQAQSF